jgi:hypothetical protein
MNIKMSLNFCTILILSIVILLFQLLFIPDKIFQKIRPRPTRQHKLNTNNIKTSSINPSLHLTPLRLVPRHRNILRPLNH